MKQNELKNALAVAVEAAQEAGRLITRNFGSAKKVNSEAQFDIKLELDVRSQRLIERKLRSRFPNVAILGEEGDTGDVESEARWVVDPIDGTVNFAYGIPHCSVSIALQIADDRGKFETCAGVILDPFQNELWTALKGRRSQLNGRPIQVSRRRALKEAIVTLGFSKSKESLDQSLPAFNKLAYRVRKIRMMGSAAISLAYVASGRFDAYMESHISLWDIAAGGLILEGAGGEFWRRPIEGRCQYRLIATNGLLRGALQRIAK